MIPDMCFPLLMGHKFNQNVFGYSHYTHTTFVPTGILSHNNLYFSSQSWQMVKTIDNPHTTSCYYGNFQCKLLCKLMARSILIRTNLMSPCLVTNVCGVFSNGISSSSSGANPRGIIIVCTVLEISHILITTSKGLSQK